MMDCRASALHFGNVECQMSNVGPILTDVFWPSSAMCNLVVLNGHEDVVVTIAAKTVGVVIGGCTSVFVETVVDVTGIPAMWFRLKSATDAGTDIVVHINVSADAALLRTFLRAKGFSMPNAVVPC